MMPGPTGTVQQKTSTPPSGAGVALTSASGRVPIASMDTRVRSEPASGRRAARHTPACKHSRQSSSTRRTPSAPGGTASSCESRPDRSVHAWSPPSRHTQRGSFGTCCVCTASHIADMQRSRIHRPRRYSCGLLSVGSGLGCGGGATGAALRQRTSDPTTSPAEVSPDRPSDLSIHRRCSGVTSRSTPIPRTATSSAPA